MDSESKFEGFVTTILFPYLVPKILYYKKISIINCFNLTTLHYFDQQGHQLKQFVESIDIKFDTVD